MRALQSGLRDLIVGQSSCSAKEGGWTLLLHSTTAAKHCYQGLFQLRPSSTASQSLRRLTCKPLESQTWSSQRRSFQSWSKCVVSDAGPAFPKTDTTPVEMPVIMAYVTAAEVASQLHIKD